MGTLVSAVDTNFTPTAQSFSVQVKGGAATLLARQTAGAAWVAVHTLHSRAGRKFGVVNDNIGAQYKLVKQFGDALAVQADE